MNDPFIIHARATYEETAFSIPIQALKFTAKQKIPHIQLTGNLTNDAKEVLNVAISVFRCIEGHSLFPDYHIHFTGPQLVKCGASWGICAYLLILWLTGKCDYVSSIAATGIIDLAGNLIDPGGLQQKINMWKKTDVDILLLPGPLNCFKHFGTSKKIIFLNHVSQFEGILKTL